MRRNHRHSLLQERAADVHRLIQQAARIAPQIEDYVLRALSPDRAPTFGVPGDR